MRNRKGYTRVNDDLIRSDTFPHLGIEAAGWNGTGWYQVKHLPTNTWVALVGGQDEAMACLDHLGENCPELTREEITVGEGLAIYAKVAAWTNQPKRPKPFEPGRFPHLDPIYRPGVTPSPAVRAADRVLASAIGRAMVGDPTVTAEVYGAAREDALTKAWRGEIMAVMPGLKESEVPERGPTLLDGTPSGWEQFQESFATLVHLGDRIQQGAIRILAMVDLFYANGELTPEERQRWDRLGEKFSGLIKEGWMEWTACASHYINSPKIRQEQVVKRVGFVGAPGRGYHQLGVKTFLRHPEIRKAIVERRVVDAWLLEMEV